MKKHIWGFACNAKNLLKIVDMFPEVIYVIPKILKLHKKWSQYVAVPVFVCDRNASVLLISS